ncbi:MAG: acyltransferase, partial [Acetobacteraceae bacterium]|nr:acyltransferase [Acetobacteraceae bacterium]
MDRPTSLYLDLIRFSAAAAVFMSHAGTAKFSGGLFWQLMPLGEEAVTVFFVLSGFVIGYAVHEREASARTYAVSRLARVYSVAVPALVLTFILDRAGTMFQPSLYLPEHGYRPDGIASQMLQSLAFTNQFWSNHVQPGSNGPYWSLAFEVWYYVIFGLIAFAPRKWVIPGVMLILFCAGPRIAVLWPMWLLGLVAYYVCSKGPLGKKTGLLLWLASLVLLLAVVGPLRTRANLYE